jgi:hypothetical protein
VRLITLPEYDVCATLFYDNRMLFRTYNSGQDGLSIDYRSVYGILAAPPCTKFSKAAWNIKKPDRDFKEGMKCVRACFDVIALHQVYIKPVIRRGSSTPPFSPLA